MHEIDFLPKRIRLQRGRHRQIRRQAATLLLVACVLGALAYVNEVRIAKAESSLADSVRRADTLARQLEIVPALTEQLADGQIKRRISRELGSRLTVNALLAELGRMLPAQASLTSLDCATVEAPLRSGAVAGRGPRKVGRAAAKATTDKRVRLRLTGVAPTAVDVAEFIGSLGSSPLFTDVNMGYAKTVLIDNDTREARSFEVSFLLAR